MKRCAGFPHSVPDTMPGVMPGCTRKQNLSARLRKDPTVPGKTWEFIVIDGISSSFYSTLIDLDNSFFSSSQRQRDTSDQRRAVARVNTDATGLRVSSEVQKAIAAARGSLAPASADGAEGDASAVFSGLMVGRSYPTYTARGDLAGGHAAPMGDFGLGMSGLAAASADSASGISPERALAVYRRVNGETSLAPWGTGISLRV